MYEGLRIWYIQTSVQEIVCKSDIEKNTMVDTCVCMYDIVYVLEIYPFNRCVLLP